MSRTLVIAETYEGQYRPATLHAVKAAQVLKEKTGAAYDVLLLGSADASPVKNLGADKVLVAAGDTLTHYMARVWTATIAQVAKSGGYTTIMATATTLGKDLCPYVAAALDAAMASEIAEVVAADTFKRPVYAGNALATVQLTTPVKVLSIRSTAFDKAAAVATASAVENVAAVAVDAKGKFLSYEAAAGGGDRPALVDAKIVVAGGRGTKGDFAPIYALADALGAAVGASRAVVDAGWAPNDWQVGQTGKVVAPPLYVAVGISGAIQHWAGMKDSKVIVAINKDPEAPIMQLADFAIVADLFQAAPEMAEKIKAKRAAGEISL